MQMDLGRGGRATAMALGRVSSSVGDSADDNSVATRRSVYTRDDAQPTRRQAPVLTRHLDAPPRELRLEFEAGPSGIPAPDQGAGARKPSRWRTLAPTARREEFDLQMDLGHGGRSKAVALGKSNSSVAQASGDGACVAARRSVYTCDDAQRGQATPVLTQQATDVAAHEQRLTFEAPRALPPLPVRRSADSLNATRRPPGRTLRQRRGASVSRSGFLRVRRARRHCCDRRGGPARRALTMRPRRLPRRHNRMPLLHPRAPSRRRCVTPIARRRASAVRRAASSGAAGCSCPRREPAWHALCPRVSRCPRGARGKPGNSATAAATRSATNSATTSPESGCGQRNGRPRPRHARPRSGIRECREARGGRLRWRCRRTWSTRTSDARSIDIYIAYCTVIDNMGAYNTLSRGCSCCWQRRVDDDQL